MSESKDSLSNTSTIIRELGITPDTTTSANYLIHSSTIPLASTLYVEPSYQTPTHLEHVCDPVCMYGSKRQGTCRSSCVCQSLGLKSKNICFVQFCRDIIGPRKKYGAQITEMPEDCAFCFDNVMIFDRTYPSDLKKDIDISGWRNDMSKEELLRILDRLYWFSKSEFRASMTENIEKLFKKFPNEALGKISRHIMFLDNMIMRTIITFPMFIGDYKWFAKSTATTFAALLCEDLRNEEKLYLQMKDFGNFVKSKFNSEDLEVRTEILEYQLNSPIFSLLKKPFEEFVEEVYYFFQELFSDLTDTLEWKRVCTLLCQNRVMETPPDAYCSREIKYFLEKITEDVKEEDKPSDAIFVLKSALLRKDIPLNILENPDKNLKNMISESLRIDTKITASYEYTREQGGKLENARVLIRDFFLGKKPVRVYDLNTFKVVRELDPKFENREDETLHAELIFWISVQLAMNALSKENKRYKPLFYDLLYYDGRPHEFETNMFKMKAEFIKEPGKLRGLSKTSACLYWVTAPMMGILNSVLALIPEHYDGLKRGAHGWRYSKRLSNESPGGAFIFDSKGRIKKEFFHYYTDWKEATDFINKKFGGGLLAAFGLLTGAPKCYLDLCLSLLQIDLYMEYTPSRSSNIPPFEGRVRRGFMMGLPLTKTILHLCQMYKEEKALLLLKRKVIAPRRARPKSELRFELDNYRMFNDD